MIDILWNVADFAIQHARDFPAFVLLVAIYSAMQIIRANFFTR